MQKSETLRFRWARCERNLEKRELGVPPKGVEERSAGEELGNMTKSNPYKE